MPHVNKVSQLKKISQFSVPGLIELPFKVLFIFYLCFVFRNSELLSFTKHSINDTNFYRLSLFWCKLPTGIAPRCAFTVMRFKPNLEICSPDHRYYYLPICIPLEMRCAVMTFYRKRFRRKSKLCPIHRTDSRFIAAPEYA